MMVWVKNLSNINDLEPDLLGFMIERFLSERTLAPEIHKTAVHWVKIIVEGLPMTERDLLNQLIILKYI